MKPSGLVLLLSICSVLAPLTSDGKDFSKPNIVVILADDLGFSDVGSFGGEIETPHLDSLAAGGVRCSQMYNAGRCCPSRASLLTGLYQHQAGIGFMVYTDWGDGYEGTLNEDGVTLGEALKGAGYTTFTSGSHSSCLQKAASRLSTWQKSKELSGQQATSTLTKRLSGKYSDL